MTIVIGLIVHTTLHLLVMNLKEKFGIKIRTIRELKGYSIEYLANIANIDRTYISDIEKGKRNVSLLIIEKLAKALEVTIQDLFDYEKP
ncbi:helix-turn-helix domain-containing protein [Flavobacterium soli]|uniref:helix-turn-helix domain-containing protein n=1 Tax=Flavobacterium soli TaxID=344881 RepID=UPI001FDEBE62|nr:helix-turn-helix transcriptional regulator [Flavobacterium soli]